jgi:hypothetical protein
MFAVDDIDETLERLRKRESEDSSSTLNRAPQ